MDPPRLSRSPSDDDESSPILGNFGSETSLILVHDDEPSTPFSISDDADDDEDPQSPELEVRRHWSPAMQPSLVFLYLLSPYLKLGAMLLPNTQLPLKFGIPALAVFAVLTAFARQIWYMLARYFRKADFEDLVLDAFARGRGKERLRAWLRTMVRAGTGMLRVLLAAIYLREAVHNILPVLPRRPTRPSPTRAHRSRVVYATGASILSYIGWFTCVAVAHAHGTLQINPGWLRMGAFWQGITVTAFAFTSSSTLALYASLKAGIPHSGLSKSPATRSFRTLSSLSVGLAVGFTLPLAFFAAQMPAVILQDPLDLQTPIVAFNSLTLLLGIPSILVTTPSLPVSERLQRSTTIPISKYLLFVLVVLLTLVPTRIARILSDILLASACMSTFFLPAAIHITVHFFKQPLSIVIPQRPATPSAADELLQRKEDALQRRQWRKRVIWDIGVWVLLLPVGGGGFVWGCGRIAGKW
ncbi:hypothetical protein HMN09_01382200 [Mycena chlorophos]|uniref:Uncharacterized protein n=1 Tax=Mycena chlorophos TaxID=658473 RepID=A0A8H6RX64_MYCCL|nr:hypothetical protein HMN09_01382200 [Mycena chlorophos]